MSAVANLATSASAVASSRVGSSRVTLRLLVTLPLRVRLIARPFGVSCSRHPVEPSLRLVTIGRIGVTTILPLPPKGL